MPMSCFRSVACRLARSVAVAAVLAACTQAPAARVESTVAPTVATPAPVRTTTPTALPEPQLTVPAGFQVSIYATGLGEVRAIAFSADGTPFVTVMNRGEKFGGKVLALPDTNNDGRADQTIVTREGFDRPHGIRFLNNDIYVSDAGAVYRMRDADNDYIAEDLVTAISGLPTEGDHWSRPFVFDSNGDMLLAIGSTCNTCQEGDKRRATIRRFHLDGSQPVDQPGELVASGLRSVVGLAFQPGTDTLWASNNGPDHLGPDLPPDQLFEIAPGSHYGWPYCYGNRTPDPDVLIDTTILTPNQAPKDEFCRKQVAAPAALLPTHSAPLGMTFYTATQFPEAMRGDLFLALHGAYNFINDFGYRVVRIPIKNGVAGEPQDFLTGFTIAGAGRWLGRPVDVQVGPDGDLWVTDDANGRVYKITYTGTT